MRWRRRRADRSNEVNHVGPVPDGDRVLAAGQRRSSELLPEEQASGASAGESPTALLPNVAPLLTRAGWWRSRNAARWRYPSLRSSPDIRGVGDHRPSRVAGEGRLWDCESCGIAWPCPVARHRLLVRYGYTPELGKLCHELLEQVVQDRPDLPVAQLFDRFVGWALPPQRWQGREEPQQPPQRGRSERGGRR